jgi:FkbM family methyltransferase
MATNQETTSWLYGSIATYGANDLISRCIDAYGEWARAEVEFICKYLLPVKGTFVDVGAFIGTHSIPFGLHVGEGGRGLCFEPNKTSYSLLAENLRLSGLHNVTPYNMAASDRTGAHYIQNIDLSNHGNTSLHTAINLQEGSPKEIDYCVGYAIDDLNLDHVDFIKTDAEGMEQSVLTGCTRLIERCKPSIFIELNSLEEHGFALELARMHDYKVFGVRAAAFNPENFKRNQESSILGSSAELAIVLTTLELDPVGISNISSIVVQPLNTLDDLSTFLLSKPQYRAQLLESELSAPLDIASYLLIDSSSSCIVALDRFVGLKDKLHQARADADQARADADQARAEQERVKMDMANFLNSNYWKIGKPIRTIADITKKLLGLGKS